MKRTFRLTHECLIWMRIRSARVRVLFEVRWLDLYHGARRVGRLYALLDQKVWCWNIWDVRPWWFGWENVKALQGVSQERGFRIQILFECYKGESFVGGLSGWIWSTNKWNVKEEARRHQPFQFHRCGKDVDLRIQEDEWVLKGVMNPEIKDHLCYYADKMWTQFQFCPHTGHVYRNSCWWTADGDVWCMNQHHENVGDTDMFSHTRSFPISHSLFSCLTHFISVTHAQFDTHRIDTNAHAHWQ